MVLVAVQVAVVVVAIVEVAGAAGSIVVAVEAAEAVAPTAALRAAVDIAAGPIAVVVVAERLFELAPSSRH